MHHATAHSSNCPHGCSQHEKKSLGEVKAKMDPKVIWAKPNDETPAVEVLDDQDRQIYYRASKLIEDCRRTFKEG